MSETIQEAKGHRHICVHAWDVWLLPADSHYYVTLGENPLDALKCEK